MRRISLITIFALLLLSISAYWGTGAKAEAAGIAKANPASPTNKSASISIRVTIPYPDRFLDEAGKKFEALHPGTKVKIEPCFSQQDLNKMRGDEMKEKYATRVNTELMSGKAADIISVSYIPYRKHIVRGMFADISQLMKSDKSYKPANYYSNLFDAVKSKNGLFVLPINYGYFLMASKYKIDADDKNWDWQDLVQSVQNDKNKQWKYICDGSDEDMLNNIVVQNYSQFVDYDKKSASFNSSKFIELLNFCKDLSAKGYVLKCTDKAPNNMTDQTLTESFLVGSVAQLASTETPSNPVAYFYRPPNESKGSFNFNGSLYALNKVSPNQKTAWEFLKFLISDDMQASPALFPFPVNKVAYKQRVAIENTQFRQSKFITLPLPQRDALIQKYAKYNETIAQALNTYHYDDPRIDKIVGDEVHPFFTGQASAQDVAKTIQGKVEFYLNE